MYVAAKLPTLAQQSQNRNLKKGTSRGSERCLPRQAAHQRVRLWIVTDAFILNGLGYIILAIPVRTREA